MADASSRSTMATDPSGLRTSPTSTALNTPELLENILVRLDMRSLLTSALVVCRQWRDLVRSSPSLRRALFFERDNAAEVQAPTYNPLLVELFQPLFDFAVTQPRHRRGIDDIAIEALPIGRRVRAFYRRNASWRRMHVRQPPVEHLGVWTCTAGMAWCARLKMVKYPAGLRMEGLYFWALKYSYEWQCSCLISWGKEQRQNLWEDARLKALEDAAQEMVRTADVIVTADWAGDCMYEPDERKSQDEKGLVRIGGRWFTIKDDEDWKTVWEKEDTGLWD